MDISRLGVGAALAVLALGGCASSSGQAGTRSASGSGQAPQEPTSYVEDEKERDKPRGGGANDREAQEQATGVAPTAGAGTQDPHPLPTEQSKSGATSYGADEQARAGQPVQQPGREGRAGTGGSAGAAPAAGGDDVARRHQILFGSDERYELSGKLAAVNADKGEITIQREGLPPALLKVEDQTRIQVDGRQGSLADLQPGGDVRASFNLSGRRPIALEVNEQGR
jgi:hypothetical protein